MFSREIDHVNDDVCGCWDGREDGWMKPLHTIYEQ